MGHEFESGGQTAPLKRACLLCSGKGNLEALWVRAVGPLVMSPNGPESPSVLRGPAHGRHLPRLLPISPSRAHS